MIILILIYTTVYSVGAVYKYKDMLQFDEKLNARFFAILKYLWEGSVS